MWIWGGKVCLHNHGPCVRIFFSFIFRCILKKDGLCVRIFWISILEMCFWKRWSLRPQMLIFNLSHLFIIMVLTSENFKFEISLPLYIQSPCVHNFLISSSSCSTLLVLFSKTNLLDSSGFFILWFKFFDK